MVSANSSAEMGTRLKGIGFFVFLMMIQLCWLMGAKVSDQLINLMEKDIPRSGIQVAESIYNVTVALSVLFWGLTVDRLTKRRKILTVISQILWITAAVYMYLTDMNFVKYLIVQIIWGISFGMNGPLIGSYLGDLFRINRRGLLYAVYSVFLYLIKGSAIAVTGIIGTILGNWKAPNFYFACGGAIVTVLFYLSAKEPPLASVEPEFADKIAKDPEVYGYRITKEGLKEIIRSRTNLFFLFQGITGMIGVVTVTRYINYWFVDTEYGMGIYQPAAVIIIGAGTALGSLIGISLAGYWTDKYYGVGKLNKAVTLAIYSLFGQVIGYYILVFGVKYPERVNADSSEGLIGYIAALLNGYPALVHFIIIFNICVMFGTIIGPTVNIMRTHINLPEHRATAAALYDLFDFIGASIGLLTGNILWLTTGSYPIVIAVGSSFWLISGILWLFMRKNIDGDFRRVRRILGDRAKKEDEERGLMVKLRNDSR